MGENVPPILGEYGGLNLGVMEELGYTVRKKDENGDPVDEIDWEKTRAVQIRSNYIYINLKGRDKYGIVEAKDKYDLEEQIISDLYSTGIRQPESVWWELPCEIRTALFWDLGEQNAGILSLRSMKALTGFMEMGYPRRKDMHRHRLPLFSWLQGRILKRERSQTG